MIALVMKDGRFKAVSRATVKKRPRGACSTVFLWPKHLLNFRREIASGSISVFTGKYGRHIPRDGRIPVECAGGGYGCGDGGSSDGGGGCLAARARVRPRFISALGLQECATKTYHVRFTSFMVIHDNHFDPFTD